MGLPIRKVAFLGDGVASDYMDIFTKPGHEEKCCRAVLERLGVDTAQEVLLIEFDAVCADSNIYRYVVEERVAGENVLVLPRFECPRALLAPVFEKYIGGLGSSTRYDIRRKERKLHKHFPGVTVRHLDASRHPEMLNVLFGLHSERWDTIRNKDSTFNTPFRRRFNEELLRQLGGEEGCFSCVAVGDEPASIMYLFLYKKNVFFYQNGWKPAYSAYSIGLYNVQQAIRYAIGNGFKTFDFLRGPEAYKYRFANDVRMAYALLLFDSGFYGQCLRRLLVWKGRIKSVFVRYGVLGCK
jgi:hypothetical protein